MKIILANSNPIHFDLEQQMIKEYDAEIFNKKEELTIDRLKEITPDYIFFPHWSYIIPKSIHDHYKCIVFHMTDLPYGRGGSPLQNLIERGHKKTVISALKVEQGIDTGHIYAKKELLLLGTAEEIFIRASKIIKEIIKEIISTNPTPVPQTGEVTNFKRRKPAQSNIAKLEDLDRLFDFIRMLDAEGYPKAFLETEHLRFEFSRASLKKDNIVTDVRITKK